MDVPSTNAVDDPRYYIDSWIDILPQGTTFPTKIIPLALEEAKAVLNYRDRCRLAYFQEAQLKTKNPEKIVTHESALQSETMRLSFGVGNAFYPRVPLDPDVEQYLEALGRRIQVIIQDFGGQAFVKLSARSPKDAVIHVPNFETFLLEEVKATMLNDQHCSQEVLDTICFWRTCGIANRVTTGEEAMFLLLNSQRIYDDITLAFKQQSKDSESLNMNVIIRGWVDIDPVMEFRAFVTKNEMCAMTQYSQYYMIPNFKQPNFKNKVQTEILKFFDEVLKDSLKSIEDYTIDFAYSRDWKTLYVVELNNPPPQAGSALFRFRSDADRKIMFNGPFEFRVIDDEQSDNLVESVPPEIFDAIKKMREQLKQNQEDCILF